MKRKFSKLQDGTTIWTREQQPNKILVLCSQACPPREYITPHWFDTPAAMLTPHCILTGRETLLLDLVGNEGLDTNNPTV